MRDESCDLDVLFNELQRLNLLENAIVNYSSGIFNQIEICSEVMSITDDVRIVELVSILYRYLSSVAEFTSLKY